ncbi:radical SAM family heme chaperone HemW [Peptoniphilus sp. KCTC 25270]|uniref:radical SAM family heme chaperone HemW n=1 Tax=Peptoniphilus sp. KCTC 25270 TaxID=2897414 RepID=UPI001E50C250|nr:radical SAM family heme chaperone HemW [Peptoniphilus sp. KCTC 25270]MCD1146848.1 radical SAM family heme chaperone HemW [Peptoniphilus sp. KCTC 25270]
MIQRSIYIHIPFCKHKCGYCDFLSFPVHDEQKMDDYVELIKKEIFLYKKELEESEIDSVFFGGGTPSMLGEKRLNALLDEIKPYIHSECEITLEANPESFLLLDGKALVENGFNRLSLGVQSGSEKILNIIERVHNVEEAKKAFYYGRKSGFSSINLDFISSVPGETMKEVKDTLELIEELNPDHVSLYSMILEEGSRFYQLWKQGKMELVEEEEDRKHLHDYRKKIVSLGYHQYEISNYAKPGHECKHNRGYWKLKDYFGFGLGSHSNIGMKRYWNERKWIKFEEKIRANKKPILEEEILTPLDRSNEKIMLGIRMNEGLDIWEKLPDGNTISEIFQREIKALSKDGLIEEKEGRIVLTERGQDLSNQVEERFFRIK